MKGAVKFPPEYFLKYNEHPVKIKPYDPKQSEVGELYITKLQGVLKDFETKIIVRGSTAYKISGKGDVEVGVYPRDADWEKVLGILRTMFGDPEAIEKDYARFNLDHEGVKEVEVIFLKGREAIVDQALNDYLLSHPKLLKEYEEIKKRYSYSKREYNFYKNKFLREVEEQIPEE